MKRTNFLWLILITGLLLNSPLAEAKKRRKKKEKSNPDIKCTLDTRNESSRNLVEVRQAKLNWNKDGKFRSMVISSEEGDEFCKSASQILWKKLVEGKAMKNCSDPLKILVREKRHTICLDDAEKQKVSEFIATVEAKFPPKN